jgi:hypothetical protein
VEVNNREKFAKRKVEIMKIADLSSFRPYFIKRARANGSEMAKVVRLSVKLTLSSCL